MCGIVGYVGNKDCAPILVDGLRRLEYRGYDSAGLAVHSGRGVEVVRAVGKLSHLATALAKTPLRGTTGIGHTRWATHGRPSERNAHPHTSGPVAVVHNGIIENHATLRRELEARGVRFSSDTDTEIVAHLVAERLATPDDDGLRPSLSEAVRAALRQLVGAYAIAVVSSDVPGQIVVAKHDSPLVLGRGDGAWLAASDIPAILGHARDVVLLEDGEMATITAKGCVITKLDGTPVVREPKRVEWDIDEAEKCGFAHFMLKEIHEQPRAIEATLRGRVARGATDVTLDAFGVDDLTARQIKRVYFVACGTSAHASMVGRYWIEQLARVPAVVEIASEVRYRDPVFGPEDLVVAVSQSGETADTLAAIKAARAQGATVLAVANVLDSAIPRAADAALYTHAGPEIGVASTKCFTTQLAALLMFAVWLGRRRGTLPEAEAGAILDALVKSPSQMKELVAESDRVADAAHTVVGDARACLFLGRGTHFPIALEGALKLKEISYVHAEGYAAGEMKHGPIALIDEHLPVVVVCPKDRHHDKTLSNVQEVRAREGKVLAIATHGDREASALAEAVLEIPEAHEAVLPLLTVIPLQLLSYFVAASRGRDVDQPRNLAKTVTVE
ncbi:MAG: glutamine--fructose-6-phosphate transaminase (isomerizing) [Deltaproteobacteria bacterium]|nr:glutamine--fructose-6-phosphate transaminase (isomerizing) [Deltaproteobacteria bacterium]